MSSRPQRGAPHVALLLTLALAGCASGSHAAEGAGRGAATGAVSGAVGGLVGALVFGGNPAESAARGAVYGGAAGATVGAISGGQRDAEEEKRRAAGLQQLREDIGDDAYAGLEALVDGRHDVALSQAEKAMQASNPNHALAGLWLEVLAYADRGDEQRTSELLPRLVEQDWNVDSEPQARERLREAQDELARIRAEYGIEPAPAG